MNDDYNKAIENLRNNPNWPPFPLRSAWKTIDPYLAQDAIGAIRILIINWQESSFFGQQIKLAIDVARDIRLTFPELPKVPIANNLILPTKWDFIELEQWFLGAQALMEARIAEQRAREKAGNAGAGEGKLNITLNPVEINALKFLYEVRPANKNLTEIENDFPRDEKGKYRCDKTIRPALLELITKGLIEHPEEKPKRYAVSRRGIEFYERYYLP